MMRLTLTEAPIGQKQHSLAFFCPDWGFTDCRLESMITSVYTTEYVIRLISVKESGGTNNRQSGQGPEPVMG
jgi:hypothetical protein